MSKDKDPGLQKTRGGKRESIALRMGSYYDTHYTSEEKRFLPTSSAEAGYVK